MRFPSIGLRLVSKTDPHKQIDVISAFGDLDDFDVLCVHAMKVADPKADEYRFPFEISLAQYRDDWQQMDQIEPLTGDQLYVHVKMESTPTGGLRHSFGRIDPASPAMEEYEGPCRSYRKAIRDAREATRRSGSDCASTVG